MAKDVEREISYQKSRMAIEKIHKSLMKKRTNLDLSLDLNTPVSNYFEIRIIKKIIRNQVLESIKHKILQNLLRILRKRTRLVLFYNKINKTL